MSNEELDDDIYRRLVAKHKCEEDHLFFTRYFFKKRNGIKFLVNWHHKLMSDSVQRILDGEIDNLIITVSPGASKTEIVVINLIARGLALNPRARFLHLSGSDSLAGQNSSQARDIITSDEYQELWPLQIAVDAKAKKRWNVMVDGVNAGGVYATSMGGQITGFRAGHMAEGFQGAIIIDDPIKPEDAYSRTKMDAANRKLLTTIKSRKANPKTPIILIMQRIAENDPVGFIKRGNVPGNYVEVTIPAVIDKAYIDALAPRYKKMFVESVKDFKGRQSYWPYKEPLDDLLVMEKGGGVDQTGQRISRHVFNAQYQQAPVAIGGNIIKGENFVKYSVLPKIRFRKVFADTAQKTKERNDYSVLQEWGYGEDGRLYLLDTIRGKWESPELRARAIAFWQKAKSRDADKFGQCRKMPIEDKASGTDLIQSLKLGPHYIPVEAIQRGVDKLTRVMDGLPYIEASQVCIPEAAPYTNDFVAECEAFTADDTHDFDDQIDPMLDAIQDMLASGNKMKIWERLAERAGNA